MLIDVSHTIRNGDSYRPGTPPVRIKNIDCADESGSIFKAVTVFQPAHSGTHIDVIKDMMIESERFIGRGVLFDIGNILQRQIEMTDLKNPNLVMKGDFVFFRTCWSDYIGTSKYYDHPELSMDVVKWLIAAGINMAGIDTPGLGRKNRHGEIDRELLDNNIPIIENLTDLSFITTDTFKVHCFPVKIENSDALPARVILEI